MLKIFFNFTLFLVILWGTNSCHDNNLNVTIQEMCSNPIRINFDEMQLLNKKDSLPDSRKKLNNYRLIRYVSSAACTQCVMNAISSWSKEFTLLEEKGILDIVIILCPNQKKNQSIQNIYENSDLDHIVYVDSCNIFLKDNSHIPHESLFHIFLLDSANNIVLVGDPVNNPKIKKLMFDYLDQKE